MLVLASGLGLAMTAISAQAQTTQRSYDRNGYCNYSATTYSDGSTRTTTNTHDQNGNLTYSHTDETLPTVAAAPTPTPYVRREPAHLAVVAPVAQPIVQLPVTASQRRFNSPVNSPV
jgi:Tfp pilus assembly protein PilE